MISYPLEIDMTVAEAQGQVLAYAECFGQQKGSFDSNQDFYGMI